MAVLPLGPPTAAEAGVPALRSPVVLVAGASLAEVHADLAGALGRPLAKGDTILGDAGRGVLAPATF